MCYILLNPQISALLYPSLRFEDYLFLLQIYKLPYIIQIFVIEWDRFCNNLIHVWRFGNVMKLLTVNYWLAAYYQVSPSENSHSSEYFFKVGQHINKPKNPSLPISHPQEHLNMCSNIVFACLQTKFLKILYGVDVCSNMLLTCFKLGIKSLQTQQNHVFRLYTYPIGCS